MRYFAATILSLACGSFALAQVTAPAQAPTPGVQSAAQQSAGSPGLGAPATTAPGTTAPATAPGATVRTPGATIGVGPGSAAPATPARTAPAAGAPATDRPERGDQAQNQANQLQALAVHCLTLANQGEVEAGKLASSKGQHEQVKEFAQMMQKDHQQALEQLASLPQNGQAREGAARPQNNLVSRLMQFQDTKAQNCQQMMKEELTSKSGAEFDMCYIGHQIAGHEAMLVELKTLQDTKTGGPEFQEWVTKAHETTQQHLEKAKQIAKALHEQDKAGR